MKQAKLFESYEEPLVYSSLEYSKSEAIALKVEAAISPLCERIEIVGSIRRKKKTIGDCDFVISATDDNWAKIVQKLGKAKVICSGQSLIKVNYSIDRGFFQLDFYRATPTTFGIQELIRTGSADHNIWLAGFAISKGFRLKHSTGLMKDGVAVAGETEESVFSMLELPCPEPTKREVLEGKPVWLYPQSSN